MTEYNTQIKELENSEVEINAEIPADEFESYRSETVKKLAETADIPGFRKGTAPESVLANHVGEDAILHEMAQSAIAKAYPAIVDEKEIKAIGRPQISLTKIAAGNPLGFTAKTAVMPDITLPDYKKIAHAVVKEHADEKAEVTDEEVENVINDIRKSRASSQQENGKTESGIITDPAAKPEGANGPNKAETSGEAGGEPQLPELTDEFVKQLGDFKDVADFRSKIRENLMEEKRRRILDKQRSALISRIAEETDATVPETLIAGEQERMLDQLKTNIAQAGLTVEDYFKSVGKTAEQMKDEWKDEARKRVKIQLALQRIAEQDNIQPSEEEIKKQAEALKAYYPNAEEAQLRAYIESVLTNEKVFEFLETS